jgi:hypothetical protein
MPLWGWVLIGVGAWLLVAVVLAFVVARVLGRIGSEVTAVHELLDSEMWAARPLSRAPDRQEEPERPSPPTPPARRVRSRRR